MRHSSLRVHLHCEENENIRSKSEETTTEHMIVRKKRIKVQDCETIYEHSTFITS
jgi:hypothetical protein